MIQDKIQTWFQGSGHHQAEAVGLTFIMYEKAGATKGKSAAHKIYDKIGDKLQDKIQDKI